MPIFSLADADLEVEDPDADMPELTGDHAVQASGRTTGAQCARLAFGGTPCIAGRNSDRGR